ITADTILINVSAMCTSNGVVLTASSDIEGLAVDGTNIAVTGEANQVVDLGDFSLIVNAQVTNSTAQGGSIVLSALHIIDADLLQRFIGLAHADMRCGGRTGGGGGGGGGPLLPGGERAGSVTGGGW